MSEPRGVAFRRRVALGVHILFQILVVVGSQGPWYQPTFGGQPLGDPIVGGEFVLRLGMERAPIGLKPRGAAAATSSVGAAGSATGAPAVELPAPAGALIDASQPAERPEPPFWQRPGFLASVVMLSAIVAFFFTSYDLVADQDIQLPPLLATLVILGAAGLAYTSLLHSTETLDSVIRDVHAAGSASGTGAAPIELPRLYGLKPAWGASVFMAAAIPMLLCSLYLTFIAQRQRASGGSGPRRPAKTERS